MGGWGQKVKRRGFGYKVKDGFGIPLPGKHSNAGQHPVSVLPDALYFLRISFGIFCVLFNTLHLYFQDLPVLLIHLVLILCP